MEGNLPDRIGGWPPKAIVTALLIPAALAKAAHFAAFEDLLLQSGMLPHWSVPAVAVLVIVLEMGIAVGIWNFRTQDLCSQALVVFSCILLVFSAWRWIQNIPSPCPCFGTLLALTPQEAVGLDALLLALGLLLVMRSRWKSRLPSRPAAIPTFSRQSGEDYADQS